MVEKGGRERGSNRQGGRKEANEAWREGEEGREKKKGRMNVARREEGGESEVVGVCERKRGEEGREKEMLQRTKVSHVAKQQRQLSCLPEVSVDRILPRRVASNCFRPSRANNGAHSLFR